jgi:ABC-type transporter Mla maintaining outer membrane lipid asymmetry permease subunit MlaE
LPAVQGEKAILYQSSICFVKHTTGTVALGHFFTGLLKLVLASLIAGALMNLFGLSAEKLLSSVGLTPVELWDYISQFVVWAIPNIILGAVIILPLWFFAYLFIPPRNADD